MSTKIEILQRSSTASTSIDALQEPQSLAYLDCNVLEIIAQSLQPRDMAALAATCKTLRQLMNHYTTAVVEGKRVVTPGIITTELRQRMIRSDANFNIVTKDVCDLLIKYSEYHAWLRAHQALDESQAGDKQSYIHLRAFPDMNDEQLEQIIKTHPEIKTLDLSSCTNLTPAGLSRILSSALAPHSWGLEHLDLSSREIDNAQLEQIIKAHPHLKSLKISSENITPGGLTHILSDKSILPCLEHLDFSIFPHVNKEQLKQIIGAHPRLKSLRLEHCGLSGEDLADILSAAQNSLDLEYLDLSRTDIHDEELEQIIRAHPHLKSLKIVLCNNLTGDGLVRILASLDLEFLDLSFRNGNIGGAHLMQIIRDQPRLKSLSLRRNPNPAELTPLLGNASELTCLEHLNLSFTNVLDEQLEQIIQAHPHLKSLKIALCRKLSAKMTARLLGTASLPEVQLLDVTGHKISDKQLMQISKGCLHLESIFLSACDNLTRGCLHDLATHPTLKVIYPPPSWEPGIFVKKGFGHFRPYNFVDQPPPIASSSYNPCSLQ